ncbi:MAG: hypothetical protein ACTHKM_12405 [Tsuneonella sp.]
MAKPSPLDDPDTAAFAWRRYKRLMKFMVAVTLATVVGALLLIAHYAIRPTIHLYIACALGITVSMMLMAALMGLVFLSNGTGHDESITNLLEDDD